MGERELLAAKRAHLEFRARILQSTRTFFLEQGFIEVQTPLLTPELAPEPHIEPISAGDNGLLITSPELYMKRLVVAGYQRIFQISPVFRRGERGRLHHPEFTLLEWYRADADYHVLQDDCRKLLDWVCKAAGRWPGWRYQGQSLEIAGEWQTLSVRAAFRTFAGWDPVMEEDQTRFDTDLVEKVEPHLGFPRPCILQDYPKTQAALARLKPEDPSVAERFELYWAGIELANGFSELTDAREQRIRFEAARETRSTMGCPLYPLPETFLDSLAHLPPCAGIALGIDRLVMLLADAENLDQVVAFPPE
jgi:elongation factor P--(R)-beta-lysine ligase